MSLENESLFFEQTATKADSLAYICTHKIKAQPPEHKLTIHAQLSKHQSTSSLSQSGVHHVTMPSQLNSNAAQIIVNIVYGTVAVVLSLVTVHQGYKAYSMWHEHRHDQAPEIPGTFHAFIALWKFADRLT